MKESSIEKLERLKKYAEIKHKIELIRKYLMDAMDILRICDVKDIKCMENIGGYFKNAKEKSQFVQMHKIALEEEVIPPPPPPGEDYKAIKNVVKHNEITTIGDIIHLLFKGNKDKYDYVKGIFKEIEKSNDNFITVNDLEGIVTKNKTIEKLEQIAIPQPVKDYEESTIKSDLIELDSFVSLKESDLEKITDAIANKLKEKPNNYIIGKGKIEFIKNLSEENEYGILDCDEIEEKMKKEYKLNEERIEQILKNINKFKEELIYASHLYIINKNQVKNFISKKRQEGKDDENIYNTYADYIYGGVSKTMPPELVKILEEGGIRKLGEAKGESK